MALCQLVFDQKYGVNAKLLMRQSVVLLFMQVLAKFSEEMASCLMDKKKITGIHGWVFLALPKKLSMCL